MGSDDTPSGTGTPIEGGTDISSTTPNSTTSSTEIQNSIATPTPDGPVYETNLIETQNHVEVIIAETNRDEKYIGATLRFPTVQYSSTYDDYYIFELLNEGEQTGMPIVVPKEKFSQTIESSGTVYTLEGDLLRIGNLEGGDQIVVGGGGFILEEIQ